MASLFGPLLHRDRSRRRAPASYDSEREAEEKWTEQFQAKRRRFGTLAGILVVPASNTGVVRLMCPGLDRVVKLLTITPGSSNSGTIYISAMGAANPNTGFPLVKTSVPLVLADVCLGDISFCGSSSGDVANWVGSGTPRDATDLKD